MDFTLSAAQREWRERARRFADEVVRPIAAELDRRADPCAAFSWDIVEAASARGLRTAPLPSAYGGAATDHLTQVLMIEELAAADMGVAVMLAGTWRTMCWLQAAGTPAQLERWLPRLGANPRGLMAAALTEPDAGSDNLLPYAGVDGGMQMSARPDGDTWVLDGTKCTITNGNRADVIVAFARTDPAQNVRAGVTTFLVPGDAPGLAVEAVHDKAAERLANNATLRFDRVRVPDADRFGAVGDGLASFVRHQRSIGAYNAATVIGVAREALRRSLHWTRTRRQGGKRISEHQAVAAYLADMYAAVDIARTYAWRAAWAADRPEHFDPALGTLPKIFAAEQSLVAVTRAMELFGGAGIMRPTGIEKLLRDASSFLHSDGTNMVLRQRVGGWLAGLDTAAIDRLGEVG